MKRTRLEEAINRLACLLHNGESAEEKYQRYFEDNPIVFEVLGYSEAYPKLRLPLLDKRWNEPDFLVRRRDGLFEILDLKTPQEKLICGKRYRKKFRSKIEDYISQVATYSEYFDDSQNRALVREAHSLDIQKQPDMVIVAGMDENVDKAMIHLLLRRRTSALRIMTYDDILSSLRFHHAAIFGHSENLSGVSWYAVITVHKASARQREYIIDVGDSLLRNRWSVYLDEHGGLQFEVMGRDGVSRLVSVRPGTHGFDYGAMCHVICEFGNSDDFSIMRILVNNRVAAQQELAFPIEISSGLDFSNMVIGTDIEKKRFGTFTLAAFAVYNKVLTFEQRTRRFEAMFEEFMLPSVERAATPALQRDEGRRAASAT